MFLVNPAVNPHTTKQVVQDLYNHVMRETTYIGLLTVLKNPCTSNPQSHLKTSTGLHIDYTKTTKGDPGTPGRGAGGIQKTTP